MTLEEALIELADRQKNKARTTEFDTLATRKFNLAHFEVGKSWDWPSLETYGSVTAIPIVETTGTFTVGSQTVIISGASSVWKGRFLRVIGGDNLYRILSVGSGSVVIDQLAIESGSQSIEIDKRFYTLPPEVRKVIAFDNLNDALVAMDNEGLRQTIRDYKNPLRQHPFSINGTDKFLDDYAVGTLASTVDSNSFTGTGTSWLANVYPGDIVGFGDNNYRVRRVEADGTIVSYNKAKTKNDGVYTIVHDAPYTARIRGEFSESRVIPFMYVRHVYDLVNKKDRTELTKDADLAILDFADAYLTEQAGTEGWETKLLKAQGRLERAQQLARPTRPAFRQFPPLIAPGFGRV